MPIGMTLSSASRTPAEKGNWSGRIGPAGLMGAKVRVLGDRALVASSPSVVVVKDLSKTGNFAQGGAVPVPAAEGIW
jgi:hypothetical protein